MKDEHTGGIHPVEQVAHHRPPHPAILEVVDDPGLVLLLPIGERLVAGVGVANRLVPELKEVGEEEGDVGEGFPGARHVA